MDPAGQPQRTSQTPHGRDGMESIDNCCRDPHGIHSYPQYYWMWHALCSYLLLIHLIAYPKSWGLHVTQIPLDIVQGFSSFPFCSTLYILYLPLQISPSHLHLLKRGYTAWAETEITIRPAQIQEVRKVSLANFHSHGSILEEKTIVYNEYVWICSRIILSHVHIWNNMTYHMFIYGTIWYSSSPWFEAKHHYSKQ